MTRTRLRLVLVPRAVRSADCRSALRQSCNPGQCPMERFLGVSARFRQSGRTQHKSISVTHSVARPEDRSQPLSFCLCQPSGQRRQHADSQDFLEATHTQPTPHWTSASRVPQCRTRGWYLHVVSTQEDRAAVFRGVSMFLLPLHHFPRTLRKS